MAVAGLILCLVSFVLFLVSLGAVLKSGFLCLVFALAVIVGFGLTIAGYQKSYKINKNSIQLLKDRLKLMSNGFLTFPLLFLDYYIFFRKPGTASLIFLFPGIMIVIFICWIAAFLTIRRKIKAAARANTTPKV